MQIILYRFSLDIDASRSYSYYEWIIHKYIGEWKHTSIKHLTNVLLHNGYLKLK